MGREYGISDEVKKIKIIFTLYNGKTIKIGEQKWYTALEKENKFNKFSTNLAQILLVHRKTDYLLIISNDREDVLGMCYGRRFNKILHLDRLFVFPKYRRKGIATLVILFFVYNFDRILWRAVHDAMDLIAKNLNGRMETIDGYRGWVITREKIKKNQMNKIADIKTLAICPSCNQEGPFGNFCVHCGMNFYNNLKKKGEDERSNLVRLN
jgi:GNAT superfamily N-acetyltransferase